MSAHAFFSSSTLQLMKSTMSGWSALRFTIFAARRVLPPDLMTPANASNPFMKETGPDAVPPPARISREERIGDRLDPVPEPNLNSIPSVLASVRMESIVSWTELMKHAEHCGAFSNPQLNQTGLLKAAFWYTRMCFRSSLNAWRSASVAKYLFAFAHIVIVSTTRPMSCRTLRSRSGVPIWPRKYLETTMLVACCDQNAGISTSRCSNTTSPFSEPMTADRRSHSTSSNGSTPGSVKYRGNSSPGAALSAGRLTRETGSSPTPEVCEVCVDDAAGAASRAGPLSMCSSVPGQPSHLSADGGQQKRGSGI